MDTIMQMQEYWPAVLLSAGFLGVVLGLAWVIVRRLGKASQTHEEMERTAPPAWGARDQRRTPLFSLRGVSKTYQDRSGQPIAVFEKLDLDLPDGGIVAILGPSGCGKSTLLNLLAGLDAPDEGEILARGRPLFEKALAHPGLSQRIALVFQELNLIGHLTAEENAALPLLCRDVGRRKALAEARQSLARLGITPQEMRRRPDRLSGGQRQRVAIARAITQGADILLADEPTGSLDPASAEAVMGELATLTRERGISAVLVTHNHGLARRYSQAILKLENGQAQLVRATGSAAEVPQPLARPFHGRVGPDPAQSRIESRDLNLPGQVPFNHGMRAAGRQKEART